MFKKNKTYPICTLLCIVCGLLLLPGCANIIPPSGGPKDTTPPVILSETPKDSTRNQFAYHITITFNKFMEVHDLAKNMVTSPLLPIRPSVAALGKKVEITFPDSSLQPNTTYRISLGNALTDNREQTPFKNFVYLFSTGPYFDSLQLKGNVTDAATGQPISAATIFLFPAETPDSAVLRKRPLYLCKVNSDGHFDFTNLPQKAFKIFAVTDKNNNHLYDLDKEKIDFYDTLVVPSAHPDSDLHFAVFKEKTADTIKAKTPPPSSKSTAHGRFGGKKQNLKKALSAILYKVVVDTFNLKTGSFDISKPLAITLFTRLTSIDSERLYLSYDDNGMDVEALRNLIIDSNQILIKTHWLPDKTYTLRLIKGWAHDTSGKELPPGKYRFKTKSLADYGTLNINVDSTFIGPKYLLVLLYQNKVVWKKTATTVKITAPLLNPGDYTLRLVLDENKNGKWDTGNLFAKKHAEKVIPYKGKILLKAGWVNDVDFKKAVNTDQRKQNRFNNTTTPKQ